MVGSALYLASLLLATTSKSPSHPTTHAPSHPTSSSHPTSTHHAHPPSSHSQQGEGADTNSNRRRPLTPPHNTTPTPSRHLPSATSRRHHRHIRASTSRSSSTSAATPTTSSTATFPTRPPPHERRRHRRNARSRARRRRILLCSAARARARRILIPTKPSTPSSPTPSADPTGMAASPAAPICAMPSIQTSCHLGASVIFSDDTGLGRAEDGRGRMARQGQDRALGGWCRCDVRLGCKEDGALLDVECQLPRA